MVTLTGSAETGNPCHTQDMVGTPNQARFPRSWRAFAVLLVAALVAPSGCSPKPAQKTGGVTPRLPDVLSYEDRTIGHSDPLINAIAPKLRPWIVLWRHAIPFDPDSLVRVGVGPAFRDGQIQPIKNLYPLPRESEA